MKKNEPFTIQTIKKEYDTTENWWVFTVTYLFGGHTQGSGTLKYIHKFVGKGEFMGGQFELDHYNHTSEIEFRELERELWLAVMDAAAPFLPEIATFEKEVEKPPVHFHEVTLKLKDAKRTLYEMTYSLGDSGNIGTIGLRIDERSKDEHIHLHTLAPRNSYSPAAVSFSAWQEYVCDQARKHSPLRLAMLDI